MTHTLYPCLWFNGHAKEAAAFYCTVFKGSQITADTPMVVTFESAGQKIMCLNGGPQFSFTPSISFFVQLEKEEEINSAWASLSEGGKVLMPFDAYEWSKKYGWVQDRFGVNWQLSFGKPEDVGQKFTPSFLFTGEQYGKAEEAIQFYTSVFRPSSVTGILKYSAGDGDKEGGVKHAQFNLGGYMFMAMDSSLQHGFTFTEAVSFVVECKTQEEIDYYWKELSKGGSEGQCGWLKDRFGVSWQVVPSILGKLMSDPEKAEKVIRVVMKTKKFDMEELQNA